MYKPKVLKGYIIRVFGVLGPGRVYCIEAVSATAAQDIAKKKFLLDTGELAFRWQDESVVTNVD